jgi:hypothetical protein
MAEEQKSGPALEAEVTEVQAVFASDEALQAAVGRLRSAGFDHADLSLPAVRLETGQATPEQAAGAPIGDDDNRSMRTLHTSMAGTVGAFAGALATVATGGAALPAVAAAAALGTGAAALAHGASSAADSVQHDDRAAAAARGELVLAVRIADAARQAVAEDVLHASGATRIEAVTRRTAAVESVNSADWTGG